MPKLRDAFATQSEASALARAVQEWLEHTDPTALFQTCMTCNHCDRKTAMCRKFQIVPPVAVITGHTVCRDYDDQEDIPF
jgi:hypothetical protein